MLIISIAWPTKLTIQLKVPYAFQFHNFGLQSWTAKLFPQQSTSFWSLIPTVSATESNQSEKSLKPCCWVWTQTNPLVDADGHAHTHARSNTHRNVRFENSSQLNIVAGAWIQYWPLGHICKFRHIKGVHPTGQIRVATRFPGALALRHTHAYSHARILSCSYVFLMLSCHGSR